MQIPCTASDGDEILIWKLKNGDVALDARRKLPSNERPGRRYLLVTSRFGLGGSCNYSR